MVEKEKSVPTIIRQAFEEKQLKEEVSRKAKELFVKYYNLLDRWGQKRVTPDVSTTREREEIWWEIPEVEVTINKNAFLIQVYSEKSSYKEFVEFRKGPREIVVSVVDVDELKLNREGNILHGKDPKLFLSTTIPQYEELCGFLEKRLSSRKGGGNGGGAGPR